MATERFAEAREQVDGQRAAPSRRSPGRNFALARAAYGSALLVKPDVAISLAQGSHDSRARAVVRILGARQLLQGGLTALQPTRSVLDLGRWVDGVHALSCVGLAALDRHRYRPVLIDGALASVWAVLGKQFSEAAQARGGRLDQVARQLLPRLPLAPQAGG